MTFLVLFIASLPPFNLFHRVRLPILSILPLCILFNAFLVLGNLSLQYNDVAFYTLARLMTCPAVVLLNYALFRQMTSKLTLLSVVLLTVGVMIANGRLGLAHPLGLGVAVTAFTVTALYQILIQRKMGDLRVSPPQLLFNQAPVAVVLLLAIVPVFDRTPKLGNRRSATAQVPQLTRTDAIPINVWIALALSGLVAALFNISQFLIIGATSALTVCYRVFVGTMHKQATNLQQFNVMGMAKVVGNLSIGWILARRFPSSLELIGVFTAMSGTWLYATASLKAKQVESILPLSIVHHVEQIDYHDEARDQASLFNKNVRSTGGQRHDSVVA